MKLRGKTVIVTGSSRGIGKATALAFAREGCNVVVNYLKSRDLALQVAREIKRLGGEAIVVKADVSSWTQASRLVEKTIERFGGVDVLVNNAGYFELKKVIDMEPKDWINMFKVHVFGAFNMIKAVLPYMIRRGEGAIINVSSIVGVRAPPGPGRAHYSAAKAALIGLTRALAIELAPYKIRVNAIAPGLTKTELIEALGRLEERVKLIPLKRPATPEEIAEAIVFLAKHDYITSEVLMVTGGE